MGEELHDGLHREEFKQFGAHAVHHGKKLTEKLDDLGIDPVKDLTQYKVGHKIPYKDGNSPPSEKQKDLHF